MTSLKDKILAASIVGSVFLAIFGVQIENWMVYLTATVIFILTSLYIEWDKYHSFKQMPRRYFDAISEPFIELWRKIIE